MMVDTVFAAFEKSAQAAPDSDFLFVPESATRGWADRRLVYSYRQAAAEVALLKRRFEAAGIGNGHRVAILLENRPAFFFNWLALNALGASLVPLNPDYRSEELSYALGHSDAALCIALPHRVAELTAAAATTGRHLPVIDCDAARERIPEVAPAPAFIASPLKREAGLLYTSGTTGKPKGCMLSNEYCLMLGDWYAKEGGYVRFEPGKSRILTPLPMFHMNAMCTSSMAMICSGGCIVQLDRFHPKSWWQDVVESGATIVHYLGVMPAMLLQLPESDHDRAHKVVCGFGSNVEPEHHLAFEKRFGFPLVEGWAMTETGAGGVIMCSREPRHIGTRCFGKVPDRIDLRIVDDEDKDVPQGDPGELILRAKGADPRRGFFSGYLKDEKATEEGWRNGWWHTGDVIRMGPDGSLHFVDRKKNVIRRSGENIAALEVEGVLQRHPAIRQIAVTSVRDEVRGEEVMACIVPHEGTKTDRATAESIVSWCLERLAYFKAPGWIAFVDSVPITATLKIQRMNLKQLGESRLGQPATFDTRAMKKRG
ncbi:MAG: AMP-binding protein [Rhodospirillaceae bacterium]|nr:AMP-binding protein [Rhodospirillaceae bacterium]